MTFRNPHLLIALSLALAAPAALAEADNAALEVITEAGISHVSGGVGTEEVDLIKSMSKEFNLSLLMATKDGSYLANVDVAIADRRGNTVLDTVSAGPYLLAKLPPGTYEVIASLNGETLRQRVAVGQSGQRQVRFLW